MADSGGIQTPDTPMHRILLASLIGTVAAGTVAAGNAPGLFVEGRADAQASTAPTLDARAREAIDAATAAALIGALQSRFEGERVELRLGEVKAERVSLRDLALHGDARIRFAGAQAWMPIRFDALYDTTGMVVESPNIVIGARTEDARRADALPQVEFALVDVSFEAVADPALRESLQGLPTTFALPDEAVDRLRAAAAQVLRESPAFRRFAASLATRPGGWTGGERTSPHLHRLRALD